MIRTIRERGVSDFSVWTVDDPQLARQYRDLGARAITTNKPAEIRRALNKSPQ